MKSENKYSEIKPKKRIKLSLADISMIEDKLNKGMRIELYPVKSDDVAIAALQREKIK